VDAINNDALALGATSWACRDIVGEKESLDVALQASDGPSRTDELKSSQTFRTDEEFVIYDSPIFDFPVF